MEHDAAADRRFLERAGDAAGPLYANSIALDLPDGVISTSPAAPPLRREALLREDLLRRLAARGMTHGRPLPARRKLPRRLPVTATDLMPIVPPGGEAECRSSPARRGPRRRTVHRVASPAPG